MSDYLPSIKEIVKISIGVLIFNLVYKNVIAPMLAKSTQTPAA